MPKTLKIITACLLILVILTGSAACSPGDEVKNLPIEITDQLGRSVKLEKVPQRLISLAPSNTEILFALGLGEVLVGLTEYCDFPPQASEKEVVGGFANPDIEKIVSLSPDLILATSMHQNKVIPQLERHGIPVLALAPKTLDEIIQAINLIGTVSGHAIEAEELVGKMKSKIERVKSLTEGLSTQNRPSVFYIVWHDPLYTAGGDQLHNEIIKLAGGENIFSDVSNFPTVDLEVVLGRNPQVIVTAGGHGSAGNSPYQWAITESRLKGTEALKEGRIYEIDANTIGRPGPRIIEALEDMLSFIHPELYQYYE